MTALFYTEDKELPKGPRGYIRAKRKPTKTNNALAVESGGEEFEADVYSLYRHLRLQT